MFDGLIILPRFLRNCVTLFWNIYDVPLLMSHDLQADFLGKSNLI